MTMTDCRGCLHRQDQHSDLAGCVVEIATNTYCTCPAYEAAAPAEDARTLTQTIQAPEPERGLDEGRARRDEGTERAGSGINGPAASDWRLKAKDALKELAASGTAFSADDVVARAGEPPVPNMLGALFLGAARAASIQAYGFTQSTRPSAHARTQRTWVGR